MVRPTKQEVEVAGREYGATTESTTESKAIPLTRRARRLSGTAWRRISASRSSPGTTPGIEGVPGIDTPPPPEAVTIQCIDYSNDRVQVFDVSDLDSFFSTPRPKWVTVRWINVSPLHPYLVNRLKEAYQFHTLAAEDVLNAPQRPKVESYDKHLFTVVHMLMYNGGQLDAEQVSLFLYSDTLISFQERPGDVWQPIRHRIQKDGSRLRRHGAGYLLYTLLDAIVDHCFPILEKYGDILEDIEARVLGDPSPPLLRQIHKIKRELALLRRLVWPIREVCDRLHRDEDARMPEFVQTYVRDVYDHTIQVVELLETYREMSAGLTDLYMSAVSNRMNEVMKVLTIMASFFIPITFLAGVYGMNFEYLPELKWPLAYPVFWMICLTVIAGMTFFFRRRGWMGKPSRRAR